MEEDMNTNHSYAHYYDYDAYDYSEMEMNANEFIDHSHQLYLYQGYAFERVIYLYIWEILVIVTFLLNLVVMFVLLHKHMRTPTYLILVAISISDSLTGLVTLPTYIAVYLRYTPVTISESSHSADELSRLNVSHLPPHMQDYIDDLINYDKTKSTNLPMDGYLLSEGLCDAFMLSKFFLSRSFHTVSVWLTVFLGLQRFLSVYASMVRLTSVFTIRRTIITCAGVLILAPCLHIYHIFKDKSVIDKCKWRVDMGEECDSDCVYFWVVLFLGQLLPIIALTAFTIYFVCHLSKTTNALRSIEHSEGHTCTLALKRRQCENRRVSVIVVAITIVFLIAELPYACFLLLGAICAHANIPMNLEFNRALNAACDVLLVVSFNANFYIYTFLNKQFRKAMKESLCMPIIRVFGSTFHTDPQLLTTRDSTKNLKTRNNTVELHTLYTRIDT